MTRISTVAMLAGVLSLSGCDLIQDWLHDLHGGGHHGGGNGGWPVDTDMGDTDVGDTGDSAVADSGDTAGEDTADSGVLDTGDTASEDSGDTSVEDTDQVGCTYTQGYWKTHGPRPAGNNSNEWPVTSLSLGTSSYTDSQAQDILETQPAGNGLLSLAHQLIAAKLNVLDGAQDTDIASTIAAADALIDGLVIPPVGSGSLSPSVTSSLTDALADFNEGTSGPGHCD